MTLKPARDFDTIALEALKRVTGKNWVKKDEGFVSESMPVSTALHIDNRLKKRDIFIASETHPTAQGARSTLSIAPSEIEAVLLLATEKSFSLGGP